ncbi:MAG: hypothetical protein A3C46_07900 [Deltaproteobacteria bacterium RIFCSPHIGHO2_02_FULL_44_16]|nr:MAG: hypothetical protein A3C46_07900 [Deltaproteobacteria bacterium RIFCSPHIGHO2_02_FULL_44_16]
MFAVGDSGKVTVSHVRIFIPLPSQSNAVSRTPSLEEEQPGFFQKAATLLKQGFANIGNAHVAQGEAFENPEFRRAYAKGLLAPFKIVIGAGTASTGCSCGDEIVTPAPESPDSGVFPDAMPPPPPDAGQPDGGVNADATPGMDAAPVDGGIECDPRHFTDAGMLPRQCDFDHDGILNQEDNCPRNWNERQIDTNGNGLGDPCDPQPNLPGIIVDAFIVGDINDKSRVAVMLFVQGALLVVRDNPSNAVQKCVSTGGRGILCSTQGARIPPDPIRNGTHARPQSGFSFDTNNIFITEPTRCDPGQRVPACFDPNDVDGTGPARIFITDNEANAIQNGSMLQGQRAGEPLPSEVTLHISGGGPALEQNLAAWGGYALSGEPGDQTGWILASGFSMSAFRGSVLIPFGILTPGPRGNPSGIDMYDVPPFTRGVGPIALSSPQNLERDGSSIQVRPLPGTTEQKMYVLMSKKAVPTGGSSLLRVDPRQGVEQRISLLGTSIDTPNALQMDADGDVALVPLDAQSNNSVPTLSQVQFSGTGTTTTYAVNPVYLAGSGLDEELRVQGKILDHIMSYGNDFLIESQGEGQKVPGYVIALNLSTLTAMLREKVGIDPHRLAVDSATDMMAVAHMGSTLDIRTSTTPGHLIGRPHGDLSDGIPGVTIINPADALGR